MIYWKEELAHDKLEKHEGREIRVNSLDFKSKYDTDQEKESQSKDHEDDALIKKFEKFLKRERQRKLVKENHQLQEKIYLCLNVKEDVISKVSSILFKRRSK